MSTNLWLKANTLSFKTKATLLAIGIGITPVAITGALSYIQIRQGIESQTTKSQIAKAEFAADKLNQFIFERNGDVEVLSALPVFTDTKISSISSPQLKTQLLDRFVASYRIYDSIAAFDLNGKLIAQSSGEPLTKNHSQRKYFQDVLKTGKIVISDPEPSQYTGQSSLFFAAPIKDTVTGKIIGVIRTRTPMARWDSILKNLANKSENYHIIDRNINKVFISSNGLYTNQPETPDMTRATQGKGLILHQPIANRSDDRPELYSAATFSKLEGMKELPWVFVMTIDRAVAYQELQGLLLTLFAGTAFTALITISLSTFFADRILRYIQRAIFTITNSASEIIDSVQSQELTVNQQANTAIDTTNTINQLGDLSTLTASQAASSAAGAQTALSLAEAGTKSVSQTLAGMSGLRESVDDIAAQIVNLGEQTGQITNVSELVSNLAKQTNMLALKAAVEAARVGEQGKGFGVVAGEIRKLAEESKKSAEKINNLATNIQTSINRTVMVTERGTKTVTEGIELAETAAAKFVGVTDAVNHVFLNSQQISASAEEQATAIRAVLSAMTLVSQGSQESAIGMHRVKTSTLELNQIADELQAVLN